MSGQSAELAPRHVRWSRSLEGFVGSWRFAVLVLSILGSWTALQILLLTVPAPAGPAADLMNQFRVLCLGMDPSTGDYQLVWLVMLVGDPIVLALMLGVVWWRPLQAARREIGARGMARWAAPGAAGVLAGALAFALLVDLETPGVRGADGTLAFPGADLRTALPAPDLTGLVDHRGAPLLPEDLQGRPVLITAVYSCCTQTCPLILTQARAALLAQPEALRSDWLVLAVTMDPERDDPARLAEFAEGYGVAADPSWRLLTGEPARVHAVLDAMGVSRSRNTDTGEIDHSNAFLLLDRAGRLAFRIGLASEAAPDWLARAMSVLLEEAPAP